PGRGPPLKAAPPGAGKTPSASSNFSLGVSLLVAIHGIVPAAIPIMNAPHPLTYPAAGVIATNPVTAAVVAPMRVGLCLNFISISIQAITLAAAACSVLSTAIAASIVAPYGSPPLNPFQPSQSIPAPMNTSVTLLGFDRLADDSLGPTAIAAARAVMPAERWITYPPEKSTAPIWLSHPPANSQ